jgi:hypothetical protein
VKHFRNVYIFISTMFSASAAVPPCLTAIVSAYGTVQQKGTVIGIFRSLGALARSLGPVIASVGEFQFSAGILKVLHSVALTANAKA